MIGGIFDSCPGPLSTVPYSAQKLGVSSAYDIPVFFPFVKIFFHIHG